MQLWLAVRKKEARGNPLKSMDITVPYREYVSVRAFWILTVSLTFKLPAIWTIGGRITP